MTEEIIANTVGLRVENDPDCKLIRAEVLKRVQAAADGYKAQGPRRLTASRWRRAAMSIASFSASSTAVRRSAKCEACCCQHSRLQQPEAGRIGNAAVLECAEDSAPACTDRRINHRASHATARQYIRARRPPPAFSPIQDIKPAGFGNAGIGQSIPRAKTARRRPADRSAGKFRRSWAAGHLPQQSPYMPQAWHTPSTTAAIRWRIFPGSSQPPGIRPAQRYAVQGQAQVFKG